MAPFPFKNVLITGGAGFIGSHIAETLSAEGCRITIIDNLSTGHEENLAGFRDRVEFIKGDIRDMGLLMRYMEGREVVFHEAAMVSVPQTVKDPIGSLLDNDLGAVQVFEAARRNGVRRVVTASSAAVYGNDAEIPNGEDMRCNPLTPYAVQKRTNEHYARLYSDLYCLETACLRYFNVYGPRQDPSSPYSGVISIFMKQAIEGKAPVIYGDGGQSRDFVYVKDVVRANLLAASVPEANGGIFNIGIGQSVTINELWRLIAGMTGNPHAPEYQEPRAGDIRESLSTIERAKRVLGYAPEYRFDEGLERTMAWYQESA